MSAYAIAHLRSVDIGPEIHRYLERIDSTLEPFEGRFLIHGTEHEVIEGPWPGHVVVIEFPDLDRAHAWYRSDAYREILPLRTEHSDGSTIIVDGVEPGYRAATFTTKVAG
jgi:uncharacterized protein (DUF1330 family)